MTLCQSCDAVLRSRPHHEIIHSTWQSFIAAVDEGCYVCQGIFNQIAEILEYPEEWEEEELRRRAEITESSAQELEDQELRRHAEITELSAQDWPQAEDSREYLKWYQRIRRNLETTDSPAQEWPQIEDGQKHLKWHQRIRRNLKMTESPAQEWPQIEHSQKHLKWHQRIRRHLRITKPSAQEWPKAESGYDFMTYYTDLTLGPIERLCGRIRIEIDRPHLNGHLILCEVDRPREPLMTLYSVRVASEKEPAAGPLPWTVTSLSTDSEETFLKIKAWLGTCENTHAKCGFRRAEADAGWYPTRLIEITSDPAISDKANDLTCRVVEFESENMPQDARYITLSHRWPQNQEGFQKLTMDNLPLWKASLPVKMLCKTFRDALLVAQRLGISYIWIDSLCIIQDGDGYVDWRKESPMMQKVYSNAEFNICASKSNQNKLYEEGLFSSRKPSSPQPLHLELFDHAELDDGPDSSGPKSFHNESGHFLITQRSILEVWDAVVNCSSLASRGWVFQEQLLSRVNIHFGDHEVLFECREMRAGESLGSEEDYKSRWRFGGGPKAYLPIYRLVDERPESLAVSSDSLDILRCSEGYYDNQSWHSLLNYYTARQLTNPDDRLVALSGVAQHFKRLFSNDIYIAGLWKNRLATEMLWEVAEKSREDWEIQNKRRHHLSFSWVSVKGAVYNHAQVFYPSHPDSVVPLADLELIKYRMFPEAVDATGDEGQPFAEDIFSLPSIPTIEVRLTGLLRPMSLERIYVSQAYCPRSSDGEGPLTDLLLHPWGRAHIIEGVTSVSERPILDFEISSSDLTALNESGRLFFMPLVRINSSSVWLLLLELVETSDGIDMGRFRRIGVHGFTRLGPAYRGPLDVWLEKTLFPDGPYGLQTRHSCPSIYEDISELPCWRYNELSKRHTIFVV